MENKWITMANEATSLRDVADELIKWVQSVDDIGSDEKNQIVMDLIEFCKYIVTEKAEEASEKDFNCCTGIISCVLILFNKLEIDIDDTDLGEMVLDMLELAKKRHAVVWANIIKTGINHAIRNCPEEEQTKAKAEWILSVLENIDVSEISITTFVEWYKTLIDYYGASELEIDEVVEKYFIEFVNKCINDENMLAEIKEDYDDAFDFFIICENVMTYYERTEQFDKAENICKFLMRDFENYENNKLYYCAIADYGKVLYDLGKEDECVKYWKIAAENDIDMAQQWLDEFSKIKSGTMEAYPEVKTEYKKAIVKRNALAITAMVIDLISFVFYFVGLPIIGITLFLGVSGVLATIALSFAVEAGGLARSIKKHPDPLVGKKGEVLQISRSTIKILSTQSKDENKYNHFTIFCEAAHVIYYLLLIAGGFIVPLIWSTIREAHVYAKWANEEDNKQLEEYRKRRQL